MLVRLEDVFKSKSILLIDEIGRYIGQTNEIEFFTSCINIHLEPIEEDGYIYYFVDRDCLNKLLER